MPLKLTVPGLVTLKIWNSAAAGPRATTKEPAPGPKKETLSLMSGSGLASSMMSSFGRRSKVIPSSPGLALAALMAARRVQLPPGCVQLTLVPGSAVELTIKANPCGALEVWAAAFLSKLLRRVGIERKSSASDRVRVTVSKALVERRPPLPGKRRELE